MQEIKRGKQPAVRTESELRNEVRVDESTRFPASGRVRKQRPVPFGSHSLKALVR